MLEHLKMTGHFVEGYVPTLKTELLIIALLALISLPIGTFLSLIGVKSHDDIFMPRGFDVEKADDTKQEGSKQDGQ